MPTEEVIELSIEETNVLRAQLGLAPLRVDSSSSDKKKKEPLHAPAPDIQKEKETKDRLERIKTEREIESNLKNNFSSKTLGDDDEDGVGGGLSAWATKMRKTKHSSKKKNKKKNSTDNKASNYTEDDLEGLQVSHAASDFETNQTAILTLADENILETNENKAVVGLAAEKSELQNIDLVSAKKQKQILRQKRKLEMGKGHASGYAAWDDEEFDELGGFGGPLDGSNENSRKKGFVIGQKSHEDDDGEIKEDSFFSAHRKVSLTDTGENKNQSDFMTKEEYEKQLEESGGKKKKKNKRKDQFSKNKKKKKKKSKRKTEADDENEDEDAADLEVSGKSSNNNSNILDDLHSSAIVSKGNRHRGKRRRDSDDEEQEQNKFVKVEGKENGADANITIREVEEEDDQQKMLNKRAKFDNIMEKGNERSRKAFASNVSVKLESQNNGNAEKSNKEEEDEFVDMEEDDAFLNAALAKARRLQKLKLLQQQNNTNSNIDSNNKPDNDEKAKAILQVLSTKSNKENDLDGEEGEKKGVTFEFDPTKEFTRSLLTPEDNVLPKAKKPKQESSKKHGLLVSNPNKTKKGSGLVKKEDADSTMDIDNPQEVDDNVEQEEETLQELSKEMKDDDDQGLHLSSKTSKLLVNRGLFSTLSLLKTTGNLGPVHQDSKSGSSVKMQEKLRGRAKDYRNYADYLPLNLKEVTQINNSQHSKDREYTEREVKLEYRDDHGRLLTSKEAYRQMCYQFHGYGCGKKNEERRLKQIQRERLEEGGVANTGGGRGKSSHNKAGSSSGGGEGGGSMGVLKATQKVTGKAFVVHKT